MQLEFTKMQGCGNDYVYLDCRGGMVEHPSQLAVRLSNRNYGIGADGLICICSSQRADAEMRMFNADGSEGGMCGNGIRCVAQWLYQNGLEKQTITVEAAGGIKTLHRTGESMWKVDMGIAQLQPEQVPVVGLGEQPVVNGVLMVENTPWRVNCISMGNPHCVTFVQQDVKQLNLEAIGPAFEHHPAFPRRVNTEFARLLGENHLEMRVWERGSGETLACGTGACAVAVAAVKNGLCQRGREIQVELPGGTLLIQVDEDDRVWMTGPATTVFWGKIQL